ncbi:MAG: cation-transporting P-type ATPase, partial [Selenomonas sp.]|nr:cation-transporting P-type ATPase [Selenomonas sp.]
MIYGTCYFHLQAVLSHEERARLAAKIRRNRNVVAVTVDERKVHLWYKRQMTPYQLKQIQKMLIAVVKKAQEAAVTPAERLAEYRRDAVMSLASFAGIEILKRTSPAAFAGATVLRSLLVLGIARKFIQNGVQGVVQDHQPNADTLTATAVIAS